MNILFINPETPSTFWSFKNALSFVSKSASDIPLGLVTVAAMLPAHWEKKLIDMNVDRLHDKDIRNADYIFLGGMNVQIKSFKQVIKRCNELDTPVVAGGPLVTTDYQEFLGVDHFILNEAEITLPQFLKDLENGTPKHIYQTDRFPDIDNTPRPMWELLNMKKYASMNLQYSRGCPFDCEFCSITMLNGRKPRTKGRDQLLKELDSLYNQGWRGAVFIVDDNFIGKKTKLKQDILPALRDWQERHDYAFHFTTEVSLNLADDDELLKLMVEAGFQHTFIGIETPNDDSLIECGKIQNQKRDMVQSVKKLQNYGLIVSGGFIVGFDQDPPSIFEQQIRFIQSSGIVTAMVGLLNAPSGTKLFKRMQNENRLIHIMSGDNMDGSINFVPKMEYKRLMRGYKQILTGIYSQKAYYERLKTFLKEYQLPLSGKRNITLSELKAFFRSIWRLGVQEKGRRYYWKLILHCLRHYPHKLSTAITMAVYGFHFRRVVETV
ncbi:MAG: DUF4070 domain-containing protein [candidate division KSB1 bacterium]|nr:DUF4070 domain-containing protein [candidate division KSB1 bacterium]